MERIYNSMPEKKTDSKIRIVAEENILLKTKVVNIWQ